ncbi:uncharacterized protein BYT42DRAFT_615869 [Radiomyces spectabilis]|uniref:uncharacterized protein n=1 Tax=Radiomyces spectabilis TaxID=64574 RepID=UPI00221EE912|nr:uncharacterized protein BYT42DRAFT_615869 [Radiomyces spectabilis]KAI8374741.1 hypothetical protein BYT42DRAFT_615869 [Radiomyces spectabilis]
MDTAQHQPRRRYLGGVLALIAVVFIWVASSFAMNSIFGEQEYNKPFLVTYLNTATFSFYLLSLFSVNKKSLSGEYTKINTQSSQPNTTVTDLSANESQLSCHHKLSTTETVKLSFAFCILWFFANYTTNASLAYTSVASSTILASMSGLFTLGIGAIFKVEKLNTVKVLSVVISFAGVILVSYSDQLRKVPFDGDTAATAATNAPAPLIGDILALLGAIFYGCYTTMLKLKIGDEDRINMPLFFGFVGLFNLLLLWPAFPLLDWLGIETFQLPYSPTLWAMVLLNAFIGTFLSDYLWLLAMLMTSPLVVTLGISLTIPLALLGDVVFKGFIPSFQYAAGAILVVAGFFAVNVSTLKEVPEVQTPETEVLVDADAHHGYQTMSPASA